MMTCEARAEHQIPIAIPRKTFPFFHSRSRLLDTHKIQAISPLVDRLMRLIEGASCVPGKEFEIRVGSPGSAGKCTRARQSGKSRKKSTRPLRCQPGDEISIVVTDQEKDSTSKTIVHNGITSDPTPNTGAASS